MATVAKLTVLMNARGPSAEATKRGAEFVESWHQYVDGHQDAAGIHGWRDHLDVVAADGMRMSCAFRDTPDLMVAETGGFARNYHLSLTVNCGERQVYERYWDIFPSMGGSDVVQTLRPVAAEIAALWRQLSRVPPETAGAFEERARAYRASATKPDLPESVREFKVRAESAVAEKRFLDAVEAFDRGLQLEPAWPQGHFNVALVLGELKVYGLATEELQRYLLLVPDAANARQAKDKIYEWRGKLEKPA